jgi:hypothetical protein
VPKFAPVLVLFVVALWNGPAADAHRAPPWCAAKGSDWGFDCSYYTFEQCMETARGLGNYCTRNPAALDGGRPARQQRRVHRS